jgi:uncharacterized membrane protein YedE/YeeE
MHPEQRHAPESAQQKGPSGSTTIRQFWPPWLAGLALGLVLLLTFLMTGHGLGATGFTTRFAAWIGEEVAPTVMAANAYLGPLVRGGNPLPSWITWEVLGVALGALAAAYSAGRWRLQVAGAQGSGLRGMLFALIGGIAAGFGARVAAGCTSGVGLSGGAALSIAAFVFLAAFFVAGIAVSRLLHRRS